MLFEERTLDSGQFEYTTKDVFGSIVLRSDEQLSKDKLDQLASFILSTSSLEGTIDGITFKRTPAENVANEIDVYDIVPDLKEGTTIEQLITAMVSAMPKGTRKRFRDSLRQMGRL